MKKTIMRFLSLVLCATHAVWNFSSSLPWRPVDDPIAGETGSGWSEVGVMPGRTGGSQSPGFRFGHRRDRFPR